MFIIICEMDKLQCPLCRSSYKQPKMCSRCSQIFCQKCVQDYVSLHHCCPSCRAILPDLADCTRLIAELKQHVKQPPGRKYKNCNLHNLPLKYQCLDCNISICSDCGMIQEKHRGHRLSQRNLEGKQLPKGRLRQYLINIEESILKDHNRLHQLMLEKEVLKSELRWCKNRLREYYQEMEKKLDQEATQIMVEIVSDLESKSERIQRLKKMKDDIAEILELRDLSDQEIIHKVHPENQILEDIELQNHQNLFAKLQQAIQYQKQDIFINLPKKSITLLNQIYPEYINQTYQFDYDLHEHTNVKYSQPFHIYGQQWRLKIYPKGNGQSPNNLSLFLQLLNAPNPTIGSNHQAQQYYFRLELISLNTAGKTISKQYKSPFMAGDCWGYNDFIPLQDLPEYLNNGHLIFVVGIRNSSYFDVCENMRRYIRKLQGEKKVLQDLLANNHINNSSIIDNISRNQFSIQSASISRLILDSSNILEDD